MPRTKFCDLPEYLQSKMQIISSEFPKSTPFIVKRTGRSDEFDEVIYKLIAITGPNHTGMWCPGISLNGEYTRDELDEQGFKLYRGRRKR